MIGPDVIESSGENGLQDHEYPYGAQVKWGRQLNTIAAWDEVAMWAIEFFGLPGDRYITELNINEMVWWFQDQRDRTLFVLRNGQAKCIELSLNT